MDICLGFCKPGRTWSSKRMKGVFPRLDVGLGSSKLFIVLPCAHCCSSTLVSVVVNQSTFMSNCVKVTVKSRFLVLLSKKSFLFNEFFIYSMLICFMLSNTFCNDLWPLLLFSACLAIRLHHVLIRGHQR